MYSELRKPFLFTLFLLLFICGNILGCFAYTTPVGSESVLPVSTIAPQYVTLTGTVKVIKSDSADDKSLYNFRLDTENGSYNLIGSTAGMEKYDGMTMDVKGNYVYTLVKTYPPLFSVVSFKPVPLTKIRTITSNKSLYLRDGLTGVWYSSTSGNCAMSWRDFSTYEFFNARLNTGSYVYDFQLVTTTFAAPDTIIGKFNIIRNGVPVAIGISGKVYGVNQSAGNYFKFYSDDMKWHMSAYITYRFDY